MTDNHPQIAVWDIWVRLFHWSLAFSVAFMLISGETGYQFFEWHKTVGEWILALIVFRLIWGVVGSSNARLLRLIQNPRVAFTHLRNLQKKNVHSERGHNAAGGWAVLLILLVILVQAVTGSFIADEDELVEGAWYGLISYTATDWMYRIHYYNAIVIQVFVAVHVGMVCLYLLYARINLITPMITGKMTWKSSKAVPDLVLQKAWFGIITACLAAGVVYLILR